MLRTWITLVIALLLITAGLGLSAYKVVSLSFPVKPEETSRSWYVELHAKTSISAWKRRQIERDEDAIKIKIIRPKDTERFAVADLQTIANDFGSRWLRRGGVSNITFTKRDPKILETIYMRFVLYELDVNEEPLYEEEQQDPSPYARRNRLANPDEDVAIFYETLDDVLKRARGRSSSPSSFLGEVHKILRNDEETRAYLMQQTASEDKISLLVHMLRAQNYEARAANGIALRDEVRDAEILRWVEVREDDAWLAFDPASGEFGAMDQRFRWWIGDQPLIEGENVGPITATLSMKANLDGAFTRALWKAKEDQPFIYNIAPQILPLDQQLVLQILLLMPIGALIVAFLRQVVGLPSFGTFMPVLIALAFRETGLFYGVLFFGVLILIGFVLRSYLDRLRLLMVPRLSALLTIIVIAIALFMMVMKDSSIPIGLSVALFPVVIMTMFIERMSTVWDERGPKTALIACLGSGFIACLIYITLMNDLAKHIVFTFPEVMLVVLAGCLLLGRYNGYKISEYIRFRNLARAIKKDTSNVS